MFHEIGTFIISIIALVVSAIAFVKARPIEKRQLQLSTLLEVFRLLTSEEQQKARKAIFDMYWSVYPNGIENTEEKGKMIFGHGTPIKNDIRKVASGFEQVAVLVINDILSQKLFFDMYAGMVCRVWYVLEEDMENDRKNNSDICKWFKKLYEMTTEYYKEQKMECPKPYPSS